MKIAYICSEANPYVKTGGLADVTFSLSKELVKVGHDVAIVLPFYNQIKEKIGECEFLGSFDVHMSWRNEGANIYFKTYQGIKYYFIENRRYFERQHIYGYDDDGERFAFFCLASLKALEIIPFKPDIIHVHDWQVGMVPVICKENKLPFYANTKFVLTIHNSAFLGFLDKSSLPELYNLDESLFNGGALRLYDRVSTLKAGIIYADKITAVSPNNRNELLTSEGGNGLDGVLRLREFDFVGILNGIDYDEYNPTKDIYIQNHFNQNNFTLNKKRNKIALCEKLNLSNPEAPLFAVVTRMTWQKGAELIFKAVHEIVRNGGNVVLLGSGEFINECEMNNLHAQYPNNVAVYIGYNNELAHQIYASSDFFMMPSLFEPCGLGQMIAERYGTLPIVRRVGGLRDSVIPFDGTNSDKANGFGFDAFSTFEMNRTCIYAIQAYNDKELLNKLRANALKRDNSWKSSVRDYIFLYQSITNKK